MKIIHVVPHINDEASGPSYSVPRLCTSLAALGNDVEISCLAANSVIPNVRLDVHPQWPVMRRFAVSPRHAVSLWKKSRLVDVVHNHSLWSMVNVASGLVVPGRGAKQVTSPRGTLSNWALSRQVLLKKLLWPLQLRALVHADLLHATSEQEYMDIRRHKFTAPVAVIPNGIDLHPLAPKAERSGPKSLLFLGRLHPTKCVDRLLYAWQATQARHPDWQLRIVGVGDTTYEQALRQLAVTLDLQRVFFPGPLYGEEKFAAYRQAHLYILPSYSENFGMTVAEALAHECPAVVSQGAPWSGLETEGCGWWTNHDVDTLASTLDSAMSLPTERLAEMGRRGRKWMARDYGWDSIAVRMEASYRWILDGGERPEWIRVD